MDKAVRGMAMSRQMDIRHRFQLWPRWVGVNALAELVGLGATLALDFVIISSIAAAQTMTASLLAIVLMTATGAVEGLVVGLLQWSVLRRPFPSIARRTWVVATVTGAVVAWFLGSLPSTLMDMGAQQGSTPVAGPPLATVLMLAAGMGFVLGAVLAYPQWRVLRRAISGAWVWIPANCVAWAGGMAVIFAAIDVAQRASSTSQALAVAGASLLLAGAVVGAVHGLALVWLAQRKIGTDHPKPITAAAT